MASQSMAMGLSEEQGMLLDSARVFCADQSEIAAVRSLLGSEAGYDPRVWEQMAELGWLGATIGAEYGGAGMGAGSAVPLAECMGKRLLATPFINSVLVARALEVAGGPEQREACLPRIAGGLLVSPALQEGEDWGRETPAAGAAREAGELLLSGAKTQVQYAGAAELYLLSVTLEGEARLLLVPVTALPPGAITPEVNIDETRRSARVNFSGVRVPLDSLLPGDGRAALREMTLLGALLYAAEATGSASACLNLTVDYLKTRVQFGRPIGAYQALKHPAVEVLCALDAARSFIYHGAALVGEGLLGEEAEVACRMAKAQASEALAFAADRAVQFHGGMGFTYECDAQLYIRRAQWSRQVFGDAYHHRKRLAALLLDGESCNQCQQALE